MFCALSCRICPQISAKNYLKCFEANLKEQRKKTNHPNSPQLRPCQPLLKLLGGKEQILREISTTKSHYFNKGIFLESEAVVLFVNCKQTCAHQTVAASMEVISFLSVNQNMKFKWSSRLPLVTLKVLARTPVIFSQTEMKFSHKCFCPLF